MRSEMGPESVRLVDGFWMLIMPYDRLFWDHIRDIIDVETVQLRSNFSWELAQDHTSERR